MGSCGKLVPSYGMGAGGSCPLLHGFQLSWPGRAVREPGAQLLGVVPLPVWVGVGMEGAELPEEP